MKYQFHFIILLQIVFFNTVKAQSEIYKYHRRKDKLEQIGKCDNNAILIIGKKKSEIAGKFDDSLLYEKLPGKNRWKIVGMYNDSFIYKNHPFGNKRICIGKYKDGFIYKKGRQKENWILVGKYSQCAAGAAFLLLLFNSDDSDSGLSPALFYIFFYQI
jgi:hypothetical protein